SGAVAVVVESAAHAETDTGVRDGLPGLRHVGPPGRCPSCRNAACPAAGSTAPLSAVSFSMAAFR
ncbi:hypothetical protein, partial [Streptomyces sp. NPDC005752]|uniref:hypothetical protein n=1 Tax=Streptomyces sp. NPDC005752 TaxID=3157065 RepID=UPI0033E0B743